MANVNVVGRQYPLYAVATFGPNNGSDTDTISLPAGAIVIGGNVKVTAVGAAALKVTVKDAAGTPISLFGSVAADALAGTPMPAAGLGMTYPAGTTLTVALSASDNAAAGNVTVGYVVAGRSNEVYTG